MRIPNLFKSKSEQSKAARDFNKRGAELLLSVNVYPFGGGVNTPDPAVDPDGYVKVVTERPRVQGSVSAKAAKRILKWQREALENGLLPTTFVREDDNR